MGLSDLCWSSSCFYGQLSASWPIWPLSYALWLSRWLGQWSGGSENLSMSSSLAQAWSQDGRVPRIPRGPAPKHKHFSSPCLLYVCLSHWPKQVPWPSPESVQRTLPKGVTIERQNKSWYHYCYHSTTVYLLDSISWCTLGYLKSSPAIINE